MAKNSTRNVEREGARTPGSAEGERDRSEQNDRADERIVDQSDEDDEFEDDDEESDDADETEEEEA